MELWDQSFAPGPRLSNLAVSLIREGRKAEAISAAIGAVTLAGDRLEPYTALSGAYDQVRGCEEFQIAAARAGLNLPRNPADQQEDLKRSDLFYNMAIAQNRLYLWEEALDTVNQAHRLNPGNPWALAHAAQIMAEQGDYTTAAALISGALNLFEGEGNPYNDGTRTARCFRRDMYLARAICHLELRDFPAYFLDFEKRFQLSEEENTLAPRLFKDGRLWRPGHPIKPYVSVILEQGLGDQIEFARLAKRFREKNPQIRVMAAHCHPAVEDVIRSMPWFDTTYSDDSTPWHTAIASLDLIRWFFERGEADIFGQWESRYVEIPGKAVIKRQHACEKTAIGFCWQGNPQHVYDWARSMPLEAFLNWAEARRGSCTFHSLQHGEKLVKLPDWVEDCDRSTYAQLGEVINACDVVVGPDTGIMHLAGAMGKPAVMLHTVCRDWRWSLPQKIYGSNFRHLVQKKRGDWHELLSRLGPELDGLLNQVEMAGLAKAMARN